MVPALGPGVDHVGPLLQHVAALLLILRLVVDTARTAALFVGKAFFDPVAIESKLIEQRRAGPAQVMDGKGLERKPLRLGAFGDRGGDPVKGGAGHRRVGVVA